MEHSAREVSDALFRAIDSYDEVFPDIRNRRALRSRLLGELGFSLDERLDISESDDDNATHPRIRPADYNQWDGPRVHLTDDDGKARGIA